MHVNASFRVKKVKCLAKLALLVHDLSHARLELTLTRWGMVSTTQSGAPSKLEKARRQFVAVDGKERQKKYSSTCTNRHQLVQC